MKAPFWQRILGAVVVLGTFAASEYAAPVIIPLGIVATVAFGVMLALMAVIGTLVALGYRL